MVTKILSVASALLLSLSASAQVLCMDDPHNCTTEVYVGTVDDCNLSIFKDFTFTSKKSVLDYIRCDNNQLGSYHWEVDCKLFDVTDPNPLNYVLIGQVFFPHIQATDDCTQSGADFIVGNFDDQPGNFSYEKMNAGSYQKIEVYFKNIPVVAGHKYAVNFRIRNFSAMFFGNVDHTLQTDENSQQMKIIGDPYFQQGMWNRRVQQPSFVSAAYGNNNMSIDRNWRHIYFVGTDNHLYNAVYSNGNISANIYDMNTGFNSAATGAIAADPNDHYVRFIGTDGLVYNAIYDNTNTVWNMFPLDPGSQHPAAPGGIAFDQGWDHVYWIGTDHHVYNNVWDQSLGIWHTWDLNNAFGLAAYGAILADPNDHYVRFIGTDGFVYNAMYNSGWSMYKLDQYTTYTAAPGAIAFDQVWDHVYFIGTDHHIYNHVWDQGLGVWHTWDLNSSFSGAAYGTLQVDEQSHNVFFIGTDGKAYNAVYDNSTTTWNMYPLDNSTDLTKGSSGYVANMYATPNSEHDIFAAVNDRHQLITYTWLDCIRPKNEKKEVATTGQQEVEESQYATLDVVQNKVVISPNPMINSSTLTCSIKEDGNVSLAIYNINGVLVREVLNNTHLNKGTYNYTIDKENLAAGLYLATFTVNGNKSVVKLLIQ